MILPHIYHLVLFHSEIHIMVTIYNPNQPPWTLFLVTTVLKPYLICLWETISITNKGVFPTSSPLSLLTQKTWSAFKCTSPMEWPFELPHADKSTMLCCRTWDTWCDSQALNDPNFDLVQLKREEASEVKMESSLPSVPFAALNCMQAMVDSTAYWLLFQRMGHLHSPYDDQAADLWNTNMWDGLSSSSFLNQSNN